MTLAVSRPTAVNLLAFLHHHQELEGNAGCPVAAISCKCLDHWLTYYPCVEPALINVKRVPGVETKHLNDVHGGFPRHKEMEPSRLQGPRFANGTVLGPYTVAAL